MGKLSGHKPQTETQTPCPHHWTWPCILPTPKASVVSSVLAWFHCHHHHSALTAQSFCARAPQLLQKATAGQLLLAQTKPPLKTNETLSKQAIYRCMLGSFWLAWPHIQYKSIYSINAEKDRLTLKQASRDLNWLCAHWWASVSAHKCFLWST